MTSARVNQLVRASLCYVIPRFTLVPGHRVVPGYLLIHRPADRRLKTSLWRHAYNLWRHVILYIARINESALQTRLLCVLLQLGLLLGKEFGEEFFAISVIETTRRLVFSRNTRYNNISTQWAWVRTRDVCRLACWYLPITRARVSSCHRREYALLSVRCDLRCRHQEAGVRDGGWEAWLQRRRLRTCKPSCAILC